MTYSSPLALERLEKGVCPECGGAERDHTGWGGPKGCTLTDYGVALRVYEYRQKAAGGTAMPRYEVRDQNGDVLRRFDSWGLAVTYFNNWVEGCDDPNAGACIFDTEDQTVKMSYHPEAD